MREVGCFETSIANYQSTLYNIPEEWRSRWWADFYMYSELI